MTTQLFYLKKWYLKRNTREKLFVLVLSFVLMTTFSYVLFFNSLSNDISEIKKVMAIKTQEQTQLKHKIGALNKLAQSPLYKKWVQQREEAMGMQYHYKSLLRTFSVQNWREIIKATIRDENNVRLVKIQILPEIKYNPGDIASIEDSIYEQKMQVSILSNYFDTIDYLNDLKNVLPHIYWNKFDYKVVHYPIASVDMEFSVFYEKEHS